jgi:N-alpha-acetyltransferase 30
MTVMGVIARQIVLETEVDNEAALSLYAKLGFIREKRLYAFYLNRKSAFRLVLPLPRQEQPCRLEGTPKSTTSNGDSRDLYS